MAEVASAYVSLMPSARGFGRGIDSQISGDLDSSGKRAGSRFGGALKAGAIGALAGLGIAAARILGDSISAASQAQQSVGGVQAVFGKYADAVIADSKRAAQGLGLSATAYNELITVSGALLKNKGIKDFADQSENLISIGADLSAMFGGTAKDAVDALNAAMRGESDPIERYGISLNETAVNAYLAKKGLDDLEGAALDQAKTQARLALITKQSADAQGAFGREADTLAGQQQRVTAQWENLKVELGTGLLPVLTRVVSWINSSLLPGLRDAGGIVKDVVAAFRGGSAEAGQFGASMQILGVYAENARRIFQENIGPIRDIVRDVATVVAALWNRFGDIWLSTIRGYLNGIRNVVGGVLKSIGGVVKVFAGLLTGDWQKAWNGVKQIVAGAAQTIRGTVGALGSVIVGVLRTQLRIVGQIFTGAWDQAVNATLAGANRVTEYVRGIPGRIVSALGSVGSILYNAGRELIQGLINGITSMVPNVGSAMSGIASKIRGFLPGSPVKEGPLVSWNNGGAGRRLGGLLVDGLNASQADVARATANLARRAEVESRVKVGSAIARERGGFLAGATYPNRLILETDLGPIVARVARSEQSSSDRFARRLEDRD